MPWIALSPPDDQQAAWCWQALQFTPRVALVEGCVLLDVSASLRLWGGLRALLARLLHPPLLPACLGWARAPTALLALALLRLKLQGRPRPAQGPDGLPLALLSAAQPALAVLERIGCRDWGSLRALPRAGVARRFGAPLLDALDRAYGERPEAFAWCQLPPVFDLQQELPALADNAPELMWTAQRLLGALQAWLRAGQRGVLALETQDMAHLRRLLAEQLVRTPLAAPANHLRLRTLQTEVLAGRNASLLPEDQAKGERLHALVERLGARLGADRVLVPRLVADHRPECMQRWVPAQAAEAPRTPVLAPDAALQPAWLLREPVALRMQGGQPVFHGPLQLLARPRRLDGAGWWDLAVPKAAARDYRLAFSERCGLLWLYQELPRSGQGEPRWFLQGAYA